MYQGIEWTISGFKHEIARLKKMIEQLTKENEALRNSKNTTKER